MFGDYGGRSAGKAVTKSVIGERLRDLQVEVWVLMCATEVGRGGWAGVRM